MKDKKVHIRKIFKWRKFKKAN